MTSVAAIGPRPPGFWRAPSRRHSTLRTAGACEKSPRHPLAVREHGQPISGKGEVVQADAGPGAGDESELESEPESSMAASKGSIDAAREKAGVEVVRSDKTRRHWRLAIFARPVEMGLELILHTIYLTLQPWLRLCTS